MNKYEEMSEFDINKLVAEKLGRNVSSEQWMHLGDRDENLVIIDTSSKSSRIVNRTFDTADYCNRWSDMGPLIESSGISIVYMLEDGWDSHALIDDDDRGYDEKYNFTHKNPLRAAAITYLLMQEAK